MRSAFSVVSLPLDCEQSLLCSKSVKECNKIITELCEYASGEATSCELCGCHYLNSTIPTPIMKINGKLNIIFGGAMRLLYASRLLSELRY